MHNHLRKFSTDLMLPLGVSELRTLYTLLFNEEKTNYAISFKENRAVLRLDYCEPIFLKKIKFGIITAIAELYSLVPD